MVGPGFVDTFLSRPDEWLSLAFGFGLGIALIYLTDERNGYAVGILVLVAGVLPWLPKNVALEWHYWPSLPLLVGALGLYEWGPDFDWSALL